MYFIIGCLVLGVDHVLSSKSSVPSTNPLHQDDKHYKIEESAVYWEYQAGKTLTERLGIKDNTNRAKNVILFLGDGMSLATVTAARIYAGQKEGRPGEENILSFDRFPFTGVSKTYCVNSQVADSACSATAFLCGVKGMLGTIGVTAAVKRKACQDVNKDTKVMSILHWAQMAGKATGIVTTTRVTHATPAGAYAHVANRDWESDQDVIVDNLDPDECLDIASQLVHGETGKNINVVLGGGRREFLPTSLTDEEGFQGRRKDKNNLIKQWLTDKTDRGNSSYIWNRNGLLSLEINNTDYLLGLFSPSHMDYHLEGERKDEPTLAEMTETAIKILSKNENGYFLFVEGGRIDHAHHETYAQRALDETVQFSEAVATAERLSKEEDTLIVVTADHSHTMSFSGYPKRGNSILSLAGISDVDEMPYATLSYANGPGYRKPLGKTRHNLLEDDMTDIKYRFPSAIPTHQETHGGEDVLVFAQGPYSHIFGGVYEQNYIPIAMMYASCMGPHLTQCTPSNSVPLLPFNFTSKSSYL